MKVLLAVAAGLMVGLAFANGAEVAGVLESLDGPNITARQVSPISLTGLQQFSESSAWINPAVPELYAPLPVASMSVPSRRMALAMPDYSKESPEQAPLSLRSKTYVTGEIGAFYGTSLGHNGGSTYGGYIISEVGNDRTQITAGASWENSNFRSPNRR